MEIPFINIFWRVFNSCIRIFIEKLDELKMINSMQGKQALEFQKNKKQAQVV